MAQAKKIYTALMVALEVKPSQLEKIIGLSNGSIGKAIERDSDLSLESVEKISTAFPQLSEQWLRTAAGPMYKEGSDQYDLLSQIVGITSEAKNRVAKALRSESTVSGPIAIDSNITGIITESEMSFPSGLQNKYTRLGNGEYLLLMPRIPLQSFKYYIQQRASKTFDKDFIQTLPHYALVTNSVFRSEYCAFDHEYVFETEYATTLIKETLAGWSLEKDEWEHNLQNRRGYKDHLLVHNAGIIRCKVLDYSVPDNLLTYQFFEPSNKTYPTQTISIDSLVQILKVEAHTVFHDSLFSSFQLKNDRESSS